MESKEIRENRADTTRVNSVIYADLLPYPTIYKFPLLVEKKKVVQFFLKFFLGQKIIVDKWGCLKPYLWAILRTVKE